MMTDNTNSTENKIARLRMTVGTVVSNKMDKTIVVKVEDLAMDPVIKKVIKTSKKFHAHDPQNECNIGDKVQIVHTRPLSKKKRYILDKILEKAK